ncbi:60S ribosomal export protein [Heterostelium album PN500]|uniref:60S ribosomal export protein NMD3 n=1 Tax=Heterostelium pallidum (strain ATCC 26659 / Pp 5 / PN500) TaxID=670386 RepID=D3B866_HETP5|nr:60S ribosomal export protein [Heterostelium album PN500]EFA82234.1 60S ribosomal export protein [Heterostelium album PN500]|eukprot:XP_020434351.1 60S ribosomal export protein [Heterostelium album PN500]
MEFTPVHSVSHILCCLCGVVIPSNPSNMCVNCIRSQVDITEGIPKQLIIQWCRGCNRYLQPPNHWAMCELESRELLTLCIKRIKGLNQVKLVDAGWVWTEPHSRRLKVKLTIQKEVFSSAILQQVFIVEFVVQGQQCNKCQKFEAKDTWNSVVQLRQKVDHKRTFLFLEQIILKHNAHSQTLNIRERTDGLDFYFSNKNQGLKFVEFISSFVPLKSKRSEQLISTDEQNNNANYKHSFSVEIVPLSKDDLVCLSPKVMHALGGMGPVVLIYKVSNLIHVIDPNTLQMGEISPLLFWNHPFRALATHKQLVELVVLDVTLTGERRGKFALADIQVARSSDFGRNDTTFFIRTHLGHLFNAGDLALGFDVSTANMNDNEFANIKSKQTVPEIILVKKTYLNLQRHWHTKRIDMEKGEPQKKNDIEAAERDQEMFYQEIENDPEMRSKINLYKKEGAAEIYAARKKQREELGESDDENEVDLEDLLDEMTLNDQDNEEFDDEGEDWDDEDDDEEDEDMDMED